jgi:hypothetical protein
VDFESWRESQQRDLGLDFDRHRQYHVIRLVFFAIGWLGALLEKANARALSLGDAKVRSGVARRLSALLPVSVAR